MKAIVEGGDLLKMAMDLSCAIPASAVFPYVSLTAIQGQLIGTAIQNEFTLQSSCKATNEQEGGVYARPQQIMGLLNPGDYTVTLTESDHKLKLEFGNVVATLEGPNRERELTDKWVIVGQPVDVPELILAIKKVRYAALPDLTRPILHCINFKPTESGIQLAAADGFRVAITKVKAKGEFTEMNIDTSAIDLLLKVQGHRPSIQQDAKSVAFETVGVVSNTLKVKTVSETYPNYERLIPPIGCVVTAPREPLIEAVRRTLVVETPVTNTVRLKTDNEVLSVWCTDETEGEVKSTIPVKTTGQFRIALNAKYLLDAVTALEGDAITLDKDVQADNKPLVIKGDCDPDSMCVLMPMWVQW